MTYEAALRTHILGDNAIAAAINDQAENETRYWPLNRPKDNKTLPAMTYQIVAGVPQTNLDGGDSGVSQIRTQITVFGADYDAARALADLVKTRMQSASSDGTLRAVLELEITNLDWETEEPFVLLDFSVWHSPAP